MNFLYPLGLLGLIGIPILIIIYIIKSKYAEQTVSSTFLWKMSEKFLRRKKPINPLTGIISLILQILTVAVVSLLIAHPIITIPNSAREYCYVLDASGSMNMTQDGISRFDRAREEIKNKIEESTDGSRFTLVVVSDITTTVFDRTADKKQALELLDEVKVGDTDVDYSRAIGVAQERFNETDGAVKTYLVTDTSYDKTSNIEVINVAKDEKNVSLTGITWTLSGGKLSLVGQVRSYNTDGDVKLNVYIDGEDAPVKTLDLKVKSGEATAFDIEANVKKFESVELTLENTDGLALDDEYVIYDIESEKTYSILLVSDNPFFLETVLEATGRNNITVMSPEEYTSETSGFGLYIFDCCSPKETPSDGAVWFFNPQGSTAGAGFSFQSEITLSAGEKLERSTATSSAAISLLENVAGDDIYVTRYCKYSLSRNFTELFSYKGNPIIFAGSNDNGHREAVFAFDIRLSNLPLLVDFVTIVDNLMTFSFPDVMEQTNYYAGDTASVNVIANCDSIRVQSPSGAVTYLSTDIAIATFDLSEVGTYTLTVTVSDIPREFYIYSAMPESEREPAPTVQEIALVGESRDGGFDGTYDPMNILFIALVILFLMDWMVYCYEKYQLR